EHWPAPTATLLMVCLEIPPAAFLSVLATARGVGISAKVLAVATTDIIDGVTVYYSHGDIVPPLRGSCAYPGLFVPIQHENRTLVDGFLTAPVPIEGVLLLGADIVIAVYLESGNIEQPRTLTDILSRSFNI